MGRSVECWDNLRSADPMFAVCARCGSRRNVYDLRTNLKSNDIARKRATLVCRDEKRCRRQRRRNGV